MRINLKLILFLTIITNFIEISFGQQCTKRGERKIDDTVAKLITIGNSGRKFPENKGKELKKYCDQNEVYVKTSEKYVRKCMTGLPKQVGSVVIYSVKNAINQLCKKDSKKLTDLIASTHCINKGNPEINKCYQVMLDGILGIKQVEDKLKIPHVCCLYVSTLPCISTRLRRLKECTENHIQTALDFMRSMLANVINLACGDYIEGSDKCEKLGPPPKKLKSQRRTKSPMIPLVEMFTSFGEI